MIAADSIKRIYASGGLCEWEISTTHPLLTIAFKNILRTFEAAIFENVQAQPKN